MRSVFYLLASCLLFSCTNAVPSNESPDTLKDTVLIDTPSQSVTIVEEPSALVIDSFVVGNILLPRSYRIDENERLSDCIDSTWMELYKKDKQYYLGKATYKIISWGEDPCSGMDVESIESKNEVLFFSNLSVLKSGKIDSVAIPQSVLQPGEHVSFTYGSHSYKLSATGFPFTDERNTLDKGNYKVVLAIDGVSERNLLQQSSYNDTSTELLFVADLDNDGKLDFVFSSPRHYEEDRILVILSSAQYTYEEVVVFDC